METIRLGIIGCGSWGYEYGKVLGQVPGVALVAVADPDPALAEQVVGVHSGAAESIRRYSGAEALCLDDEIDAVVLTTPTPTHHKLTAMALEAGKHVLVEKPMAITLENAREMVASAERSGRHLMVGQIVRFIEATIEMRSIVRAGAIGSPMHAIELRYGSFRSRAWPEWWKQMDGFLLHHLGSHSVDAILWILEKRPLWTFAAGIARKVDDSYGAIDAVSLSMSLEDDVLVGVHQESYGGQPDLAHKLLILGEYGRLEMDDFKTVSLNGEEVFHRDGPPFEAGLKAEVVEFTASIREDRPPSVSGRDVLLTMAALEAARKSLYSKRAEPVSWEF